MEPSEIFELIIKADDAIKYATEDRTVARAQRAREFLLRARDEAAAIGNEDLVQQAERRLDDIQRLLGEAGPAAENPTDGR